MGEEEKEGPQSTFSIYLAEGDKLFIEGQYKKALSYYNQALELEPDSRTGLVARSKCYLALGDRKTALEFAEASLKENKTFVKGLYQKAEVLYSMGEFEFALVFYERGHKLRPELAEFSLGIQKAKEAIANSVGGPEVVQLENKGDLTYFKQQQESPVKKKLAKQVGMIQRQGDRLDKKRSPPKPYGSKHTVRHLLGELNSDKEYMEGIFNDKDMMENSRLELRDIVIDGLEYLDRRTEFWRQQQPIYSRKRDKYLRNIKPPITVPVGPSVPAASTLNEMKLEQETIEVAAKKEVMMQAEAPANENASSAQALKSKYESELARAIPALEAAITALNTIKQSDIAELKSLSCPPSGIKLVLSAICVMNNLKPDKINDPAGTEHKILDFWRPAKKMLSDPSFLKKMFEYDKDNIQVAIMSKIRKEFITNPDFDPSKVKNVSAACEGLCRWVVAMEIYDRVSKIVAHKKMKLKEVEAELLTSKRADLEETNNTTS